MVAGKIAHLDANVSPVKLTCLRLCRTRLDFMSLCLVSLCLTRFVLMKSNLMCTWKR